MTASVILLVSLGGGAYVGNSGRLATFSQTLDMKPQSSFNLTSIRYEIYDYPPGMGLPSGWSQDPSTLAYYFAPSNVTTQPPTVTLPASGPNNWGPIMLRLRGNNNPLQFNTDRSPNTFFNPSLTDESSMIWLPSPNAGMQGVGFNESTQRDAMRGWDGPLMQSLRVLDSSGGGSSGVSVGGAITPNTLTWPAGATSPTIQQTAAVSGAGQNTTLAPQPATTTGASGNLVVNVGAPASGTTEAGIIFERLASALGFIGAANGLPTTFQISFGYGTGANTGAYILENASSLFINTPGGTIRLESNNSAIVDFTGGAASFFQPVQGGQAGNTFRFGASAIGSLTGGTTTLTGAQQQTPTIRLSGTLTSDLTIAINGIAGHFFFNCRALTLSGHNLILTNGAGTVTVTSLLSATKTLLTVDCDSTSTLSVG